MQPNPTQPMPNPFLTNAPNKKGRPQLPVQENPFLSIKCNSFSEQKCIPEPVQSPPSFEELFPSLTKSNAKSNSDKSNSDKSNSDKSNSEQSPVPKLNFKSAVKGQSASQSANTASQSANPISQSANPISQPASQIQNQFLRPMNQFLQPRSHDHANRMRYGYDDSEFNDDDGDNHDAYDSAYTKYYDD
jgi:hypothetical protein